jgi:hypothetical protein
LAFLFAVFSSIHSLRIIHLAVTTIPLSDILYTARQISRTSHLPSFKMRSAILLSVVSALAAAGVEAQSNATGVVTGV